MEIRRTQPQDIDQIAAIYEIARSYMRENGNASQWNCVYPGREDAEEDMALQNSYVCVSKGQIVATFAFIIGEEPNYQRIEQGEWRKEQPYGTIHRLASNGKEKGVAARCFDYCRKMVPYLRIDTHKDNLPMRNVLKSYGFKECGIIYVEDGTPRIAYDYLR